MTPSNAAIGTKTTPGMPGTKPMRPIIPAATKRMRGLEVSCSVTSAPMSWALDTRVTMIAAAVESSMEGICATRPSPMVSRV